MVNFLYLNHIRDIQGITQNQSEAAVIFGKNYRQVSRETRGQDTSAVRPPIMRNHIAEQVVIPRDTNDQSILRAVIKTMAEQVAFQLRKRQQISKRVKLEIHYTDGLRSTRYDSVSNNNDKSVVKVCYRLFELANYRRNRVRTIIIDASRFIHFADQVSLFETATKKNQKLSKALDIIRRKHGANSIHSASALGNVPKQNSAWIKKIDKVLDQTSPVWTS